jgi:hypothetical protein
MNYKETASRYIKENFADDDRLAVVLIERERQLVEQKFVTAEQLASEKYLRHLAAANAQGRDVYVGQQPLKEGTRNRTKADIKEIKHVYIDVDSGGQEALERIRNAPGMPRAHHELESSPEKYQMIYRVQSFTPTQAETLMRNMARELGGDPAATDSSRILRVPGYRNWKYKEPHFVRDVSLGVPDKKVYSPSDFPEYQARPQEPPIATPRFGERATRSLDSGVDQSTKDYAYALRQLEKGESPDYIRNKIADFRRPDGKHPHVDDYARRTVNAAQRHYTRISFSAASAGNEEDRGGMER